MKGIYISCVVLTVCAACLQYGQGDFSLTGSACSLTAFPNNVSAEETFVELQNCLFSEIKPGELDHLSKLEYLQMAFMPSITSFPNVTAVGNTLEILLLSNNAIAYINPTYLNALVVLQRLNIANNLITMIPNVPGLKQLNGLYARSNSFTEIPQLTEWTEVRKLDLSEQDNLKVLPTGSFAWMTNVVTLQLNYLGITELPDLESVPNLKKLHLIGSSMESVPSHHTAVLGGLLEFSLQDTAQLQFLPTLCSKEPHSLSIDVSGSGLRLCDCRHAWLKAAVDAGATVTTQQQVVCGGEDWSSMTTARFLTLCHQHSHHRKRQIDVTKRSSPLFCAFPRGVIQSDVDMTSCILQCVSTKGCLSVNFRPTVAEHVGECVLLAPSLDGGHEQADDEEGWILYGLLFKDMI